MYCPFCGTDNAVDQKYCRNCGATLPTSVTKPPTKAHKPVSTSNPRPSSPFVPPAPPSLPKRSKPLEAITPSISSLEEIDPGATNLSYKLPNFNPKNAEQPQASGDVVDNFYETQAISNTLSPNKSAKPNSVPNVDLRTVEMSSLNGSDEDLKSTSVGMPVANLMANNASKNTSSNKSEEYFPTVLTQPKPPESPEEQLRLLRELMEAGGESWKVPPPAPPPPSAAEPWKGNSVPSAPPVPSTPSAPSTEQTLSMAALPKPVELSNTIDHRTSTVIENTDRPFDKTLTNSPPSKSHQKLAFDQTLNSAPAFPLQKNDQKPSNAQPNTVLPEEEFSLNPIPQTLTMKAAPKGKASEDFSYPNLEGPITSEEVVPETIQMQKPPENKDIASALNSWSSDVTNPWGTPAPSLAPPTNLDAKTESLSNKAFSSPQQEKAKSKKDAFKTISVGPRTQKPGQGQKDSPTNSLSSTDFFVDEDPNKTANSPSPNSFLYEDPNKTTVSNAYADLIPQERPLANTAPISIPSGQPAEAPPKINPNVTPPNQQFAPPTIPTPVTQLPENTATPPLPSRKRSLKIPLLIGIILFLLVSIVFIAWKLIENISSTPKTTATPIVTPSPIASPIASATPTPQASITPEPVAVVPENMMLIPGGEYKIGSDSPGPDGDTFSSPQHTVKVSAFYMDVYEVTNEEYNKFAEATGHAKPSNWQNGQYPGKAQDPVANVSWQDAQDYAKWADKRLPTEEEWEVAASGQEHSLYPWGNEPDTKRANSKEFGAKSVRTVGSVKTSKSSFGLYDMSGNVWEWTSSPAKAYPNAKDPKSTDPSQQRIFRGGSYQDKIEYCSTTFRGYESMTLTSPILGFRCAKDAPQK